MNRCILPLVLIASIATAQAASFDCNQAATLIEKAICTEPALSTLDDQLLQAYKDALLKAASAETIKAEQRNWLKNIRNKCQNSACLHQAYLKRINELLKVSGAQKTSTDQGQQPIVMGRCHMDTCWWMRIESLVPVKSGDRGNLIKARVRNTSEEYTSAYVDKHGYPALPKKHAVWDEASDVYLFCSNTLPSYISYEEDKKHYSAIIPFGNDGVPWGFSEGAANLYNFVCNGGKHATYHIDPTTAEAEIVLAKPTDILAYGKSRTRTLEGIITSYECGDNCYLTITDLHGQDHTGLCGASICELWGKDESSFSRYKGKKVRITVDKGQQVNGEGEVMGEMDEFVKIEAL